MQQQKCRICGERHRLGHCPANDQPTELKALASRVLRRAEAATLKAKADTSSAQPAPKPRAKPSVAPPAPAATHAPAHQFAPAGQCQYCDHRRAKVGEAVRLHRSRKLTPHASK